MTSNTKVTLEEVLDRFVTEDQHDEKTLERYVLEYPEFALKLIDLSRLIATSDIEDDDALSPIDKSRIDAAWITHSAAKPAPSSDPFTALTAEKSKALSVALGMPRQVIICFCEHKVVPNSVPMPILRRFADELEVPLPHMIAAMGQLPQTSQSRSYKADGKPALGRQVSFEQLLIDAGVSDEDRARLLAEM